MDGGGRWHPWRDLRGRTHIDLEWGYLPHGRGRIEDIGDGRRRITLDARLDRRTRAATLGHELVHDERGGGCDIPGMPESWAPEIVKEERRVDRIVARRLVPLDELGGYIRRAVDSDLAVTVPDVAEEWDTTAEVARDALHEFARRHAA
jgi:hypothetical protein